LRPMRFSIAFALPLALLLSVSAVAQSASVQAAPAPGASDAPAAPPAKARPKIGLALSGGGARGVTHIGVLRALEEMHIPIDYIAGTSMGAVVGGLYASGASTEELAQLIQKTNWVEIFSDRPVRDQIPFRQKADDKTYIEGLNLGLDSKGLHLKKGLINGQKLMFLLENNTLRVSDIHSFDDLPIPFRCVSTDIVTGEKYIFSKGSLPVAIRSSMSLPAVFTPTEVEGHLLVDGGIADNLPVDVVRAMGADIVIAVDIGTPPLDRAQITNPIAVYSQVLNLLMQKEIDVQMANANILLRPDLGGFSNMDFPNSMKLVPLGEEVAKASADKLAPFAVSPQEYAAWQARVRGLPPPPPTVDFVEFTGTDPKVEALVRGRFKTKPGQPLNLSDLGKDLVVVYNTGEYTDVSYELVKRGDKQGVLIHAESNPMGPNYMRFGIQLSSDFSYNSNWSVFAGLRMTHLNRLGAEWKSDLEVGLNQRLYTEFYQPLDLGARAFVVPYARYVNELDYVFFNARESEPSASYRTGMGYVGFDFGFNLGLSGEVRFGPRWGRASYSRAVGVDLFPNFHASIGEYRLAYKLDRLDSADLPTKGLHITLDASDSETGLGATAAYQKGELKVKAYQHLGERSGVFEWIAGGTDFGSNVPYYDWFRLGGPGSFGGYMDGQLTGPNYWAARLGYQYQFATLPAFIGKGLYVMVFADAGKTWIQNLDDAGPFQNLKYSGTVAFGSSTKFGPVLFGYSYASGKNQQLFVSLGKRW
jgi:NTE family protein